MKTFWSYNYFSRQQECHLDSSGLSPSSFVQNISLSLYSLRQKVFRVPKQKGTGTQGSRGVRREGSWYEDLDGYLFNRVRPPVSGSVGGLPGSHPYFSRSSGPFIGKSPSTDGFGGRLDIQHPSLSGFSLPSLWSSSQMIRSRNSMCKSTGCDDTMTELRVVLFRTDRSVNDNLCRVGYYVPSMTKRSFSDMGKSRQGVVRIPEGVTRRTLLLIKTG